MPLPPVHTTISLMLPLLVCGACAMHDYRAKPLVPERSAAQYATRSAEDAGLRRTLQAHGVADTVWPLRQWDLDALTLLAFYFHPDLKVARAKVASAQSAWQVAQSKPAIGVTPRAEYRGRKRPEDSSPWSLGFEVDLPVAGGLRQAAIAEAGQVELESARLQLARSAWQIRSRVHSAILDLYTARRGVELSESEVSHNEALVKLLQRRLHEGMASVGEVTTARLRATEARAEAETHKLAAERALGQLSSALGLPLEVTRMLPLEFAQFDTLPGVGDAQNIRAKALLNRADIRVGLLAYAGAESALKLEVARQYPELRLSPGYQWNQGTSVWSLALGLVLPATLGNDARIRQAMAQREVAAREFEQLQQRVLSESAAGAAVYRQALAGLSAIESQSTLVKQRLGETEKLFNSGYADRVALVQSKLEAASAARASWAARRAALEALGQLEDALQVPLRGRAVPNVEATP